MEALSVFEARTKEYSVKDGKRASRGVATVQEWCNYRGSKLTVDGLFGAKTEAAVKQHQKAHGASVDGVVGPQTWGVLVEGRLVVAKQEVKVDPKFDHTSLSVTLVGTNGEVAIPFIFDTGAFELLLVKDYADKVGGLPNLGASGVSGVAGNESAYKSKVTAVFGGVSFMDVECVVVPSGFMNLWGLKFALNRGLSIDIDKHAQTIAYYR